MDTLIRKSLETFEETFKKHPKGSYRHEMENMKHLVCMTARQIHFKDTFEDAHQNCVDAGFPFIPKISEREDVSNMLDAIEYVGAAMKTDPKCIEPCKELSCVSGMMYHTNRTKEEAVEWCKNV